MADLAGVRIPEAIWQFANPVDRLREEMRRLGWMVRAKSRRHQQTHELAHRTQTLVKMRLRWMGFGVIETSHKAAYDLLAGQYRIEVKAARWTTSGRPYGGRYKVLVHNQDFDYMVICCLNGPSINSGRGGLHFFVIPQAAIGSRRTVEITSQDVARYSGRWAPYREAWQQLNRVS